MADRGGERRGRGRASAGAARQAPAALSAAFTDSGGNAGLMADLRTFRDFRVHGCAAVAGVTAQNPRGVYAVHDVPENVFRAQAEAVLSCFAVKAAKTGMLHSAALVAAAADVFAQAKIPLVADPVMVATSGAALLEPDAVKALQDRLLPVAFAVTPNIPEAEILSGMEIRSLQDGVDAACAIYRRFGCAVLLKGGHARWTLPREIREAAAAEYGGAPVCADVFLAAGGEPRFLAGPKTARPASTHGTGCTMSAALAAALAKGESLERAAAAAKAYTGAAIANSYFAGPGAGVLG